MRVCVQFHCCRDGGSLADRALNDVYFFWLLDVSDMQISSTLIIIRLDSLWSVIVDYSYLYWLFVWIDLIIDAL